MGQRPFTPGKGQILISKNTRPRTFSILKERNKVLSIMNVIFKRVSYIRRVVFRQTAGYSKVVKSYSLNYSLGIIHRQ